MVRLVTGSGAHSWAKVAKSSSSGLLCSLHGLKNATNRNNISVVCRTKEPDCYWIKKKKCLV